MDARERLRVYLEQRREQGEREMMLDGMSVDDVLKVVGGLGASGLKRAERKRGDVYAEELARREARGAADAAAESARLAEDGAPLASAGPPATPAVRPPVGPTAATGVPPGDPGAGHGGDWRAALRATGSAPRAVGGQDAGMAPSALPGAATPAAARGETPPAPDEARMPSAPPSSTTAGAPSSASRPPAPASPRPARAPLPWPLPGIEWPVGLVVGEASSDFFGGPIGQAASIDEVASLVAECTRCPLYSTAKNPVPGEGDPNAEIFCVGEAPGATEDETGRPFVGQSGELLTKILAAIKLRREDVFIANVLKHRPPGNRNPAPDEIAACSPYLVRQLELTRPKVIICWGTFAAQALLGTRTAIGKLRGQVHRYYGTPLIVTYHPAALLRNSEFKRPTWEDVQLARRILDLPAGG